MKLNPILILVYLFFANTLLAQTKRHCYTDEKMQQELAKNPHLKQKMEAIESFTKRVSKRMNRATNNNIIKLPVVVHIIYNSSKENISEAQIKSQIDVLNEDFRRTNSDKTNKWSQAADVGIEFYLAKVDPNGNPTSGITRKYTTKKSWGTGNDMKRSSKGGVDAWNTSEYLNMWVCNIGGGTLGFAYYPGATVTYDGVVMSPQYFGSSDKGSGFYLAARFDKGRTTTHEVGHYLNLMHIWGNGCGSDDKVSDTPSSDRANYGCSSNHYSCGSLDMVENYMDYSDDSCMNLFTLGQKNRMRVLFEPGGARRSLALSDKTGGNTNCLASVPVSVNISSISSTGAIVSWSSISEVTYDVRYRQSGTSSWIVRSVSDASIKLKELKNETQYEVQIRSKCTNGSISSYSRIVNFTTNKGTVSSCSETVRDFPYNQGFESGFGWTQLLGDNGNWTRKSGSTTSGSTGPSSAIEKRYYMYLEASTRGFGSIGSNATAILESPCFDLSSVTSASFGFKNHMYGVHMGTLRVQASTDGSKWKDIWTASGDKGNQWNTTSLDLSSYLGNKLKLRFVGKTGRDYKSDIAIDDLSLTTSGAASDGQAPTTPSNLSASNITQTEATLSWTASSDNTGVIGYNIYQGSTKIATVTETSYKVTGLKANSRYKFSVKAIDKAGNESASSNLLTVLTDAVSINYCTSKGNSSTFEWIDYVSFGGMTNSSRSDSGYGDYTDKVATVSRNSSSRLYFSAGFSRTIYKEYWAVWIDYNQDGIFSDDEKVVSTSSRSSRNLYTNIKIPSTALLGSTRMRVSMTDRGVLKPCNSYRYGEVEDYSVNITSSGDSVLFSQVNSELLEEELFVEEPICYPNPVTDNTVTIRFGSSKNINFLITDEKGSVFGEGNIPNNSKVDVSYLNPNVRYILKVNDGQKSESMKLIKK